MCDMALTFSHNLKQMQFHVGPLPDSVSMTPVVSNVNRANVQPNGQLMVFCHTVQTIPAHTERLLLIMCTLKHTEDTIN